MRCSLLNFNCLLRIGWIISLFSQNSFGKTAIQLSSSCYIKELFSHRGNVSSNRKRDFALRQILKTSTISKGVRTNHSISLNNKGTVRKNYLLLPFQTSNIPNYQCGPQSGVSVKFGSQRIKKSHVLNSYII
jgi:hypothetical protein